MIMLTANDGRCRKSATLQKQRNKCERNNLSASPQEDCEEKPTIKYSPLRSERRILHDTCDRKVGNLGGLRLNSEAQTSTGYIALALFPLKQRATSKVIPFSRTTQWVAGCPDDPAFDTTLANHKPCYKGFPLLKRSECRIGETRNRADGKEKGEKVRVDGRCRIFMLCCCRLVGLCFYSAFFRPRHSGHLRPLMPLSLAAFPVASYSLIGRTHSR